MSLTKPTDPKRLLFAVALIGALHLMAGGAAQAQTNCATQTDIPEIECDFLQAVYDTMGGGSWWSTTWMHDQFPCSWTDITCEGGHIVGIQIYEENMFGTFPATIENLTFLETLSIREAGVSVPPEFYNLDNIRALSGYNSDFFDVTTDLLNFPDLETLSLIGNPGALAPETPTARGNQLPAFLGQLSNLRTLTLYNQGYQGTIPAEIGDLENLEHLNLTWNNLTSPLPAELTDLTNLKTLSLSSNQFTGPLPPEWVFLTQLETLRLGWNNFSGTLPNGWGNLANLRYLSLNNNDLFSFVPPFWSQLDTLEFLSLRGNSLTGPIPAEWGSFPNLEWIDLSHNRFTGGVHPNLGDGVAYPGRTLYLEENHLDGEIPPSWADGQLLQLSIAGNCLTTANLDVVAFLDEIVPGWFETQCLPIFIDGFDAGSANNWDRIVPGTP